MRSKLAAGVLANYASLIVMGASGLVINLAIARLQGSAAQGVFNQIYAVFVILSQLSCGALHHSAQKHIAEHSDDPGSHRAIAWPALGAAALSGAVVSLALYLLAPRIGRAFDSLPLADGLKLVAPGLFLFTLNKVMLGILNGQRLMLHFAALQTTRSLLLALGAVTVAWKGLPAHLYGLVFTLAEAVVLFGAAVVVERNLPKADTASSTPWLARHLQFGARGLVTGILTEANLRVDILVLGLLADDATVGIYSLVSAICEAFYNLFHVVRINLNPLIASELASGNRERLQALIGKVQPLAVGGALLVALVTVAAFPLVVQLLIGNPSYLAGLVPLAILLAGFTIYAAMLPFDFALLQAGFPALQSAYLVAQVAANLALNLVLVPRYGMQGSAIATALAFVLSMPLLAVLVRRNTGLSLAQYPWRT
jgi:O-antigen/teichoic acid export membrane protein